MASELATQTRYRREWSCTWTDIYSNTIRKLLRMHNLRAPLPVTGRCTRTAAPLPTPAGSAAGPSQAPAAPGASERAREGSTLLKLTCWLVPKQVRG